MFLGRLIDRASLRQEDQEVHMPPIPLSPGDQLIRNGHRGIEEVHEVLPPRANGYFRLRTEKPIEDNPDKKTMDIVSQVNPQSYVVKDKVGRLRRIFIIGEPEGQESPVNESFIGKKPKKRWFR